MLVLSRKSQQSIVIDGNIKITVVRIDRNQVRIGIEAPDSVRIQREELLQNEQAHPATTIPIPAHVA